MYRDILRTTKVAVEKATSVGLIALMAVLSFLVAPSGASAAGNISGESTSLSNPTISQTAVTYTLDMDLTSASLIRCIRADFGTAADGTGAVTGMDVPTPATSFGGDFVPTPASWTTTFTVGTSLWQSTLVAGETPASASDRTIVISGVTNGSTADEYFVLVTTFSDAACTTSVDTLGQSAFALTQGVTVSATVDPTLTFTVDSTTCNLGTLTATTTGFCSHTMTAASNATSGYAISYIASATLTSPASDSITENGGTAVANSIGNEQFGLNLVANTTPTVGAAPSGDAGGVPAANYNTADSFAFNTSGATVATATAPTTNTVFTVSYIANITSATEAGLYTKTQTYNITATY